MKKTIPIGYEDIKELIDKNLYYVDKTIALKDFLDVHANVIQFTRPRRFGKTLNQSMFRRFFEDERKPDGSRIDNGYSPILKYGACFFKKGCMVMKG